MMKLISFGALALYYRRHRQLIGYILITLLAIFVIDLLHSEISEFYLKLDAKGYEEPLIWLFWTQMGIKSTLFGFLVWLIFRKKEVVADKQESQESIEPIKPQIEELKSVKSELPKIELPQELFTKELQSKADMLINSKPGAK